MPTTSFSREDRRATMKAFLARFNRSPGSRVPAPAGIGNAYDRFASLPFELHMLLIAYLEPVDIDAALAASRVLRLIWLSDEMWPTIVDRWFPGLGPGLRQHTRITDIDEPARSELLRRRLHLICKRTEGKFTAAIHYGFGLASDKFFQMRKDIPVSDGGVHSYESVEDLEISDSQRSSRFLMYSNGRVAWWPEGYSMPYFAIVDNLRTRERRAYLFPDHGELVRGYRTAMGNTLFIMSRDTKIHVWHLELNRLESFEVPQSPKRCITEGETVLVVSQTSDVYIWKFGQSLQHIDVHRLSCYPKEYLAMGGPPVLMPRVWRFSQQGLRLRNSQLLVDFILSPTTCGAFFVITLDLDETGKLTVYEICDEEIAATYVLEERIYSDSKTTEKGLLRWNKLNSFGGYCLVQLIQEPSASDDGCSCGRKSRELVSLCFNVYTKSFSVLRHHVGGIFTGICHLWNNRLLIMPDPVQGQQATPVRRPVMSLTPCSGINTSRESTESVPVYTTTSEGVPFVYRRRQSKLNIGTLTEGLDIEHGVDVLQEFSPKPTWNDAFIPCPSELNPGKLVGDDEFFIFVNAPSYTVLKFGEDFPTRPPPLEEESRSWWRKPRDRIGSLGKLSRSRSRPASKT
ncbi:hypothetical protein F4861DRAFT_514099 [Xylaria intraflava]|nr:hypothetical protein F4861DRAFT_514099 [Xylaria intraflava]